MSITIGEAYRPGCIDRIVQLQAAYYSASNGFTVEFEAKVARKLGDFLQFVHRRKRRPVDRNQSRVRGSIEIDGAHADEDGAHLRWLTTSDVLRGQGLGQRPLGPALEFTDACGYRRTYLLTFDGLAARGTYTNRMASALSMKASVRGGEGWFESRYFSVVPSPSR
jgi:GNAT superfamily N-acetyltransferase